jgi:hypothetical protein
MSPENQALTQLRAEIVEILFSALFLFIGLTAGVIAGVRRRSGVRAIVWLGIWSAVYGVLRLVGSKALVAGLLSWVQTAAPYVRRNLMEAATSYCGAGESRDDATVVVLAVQ